MVTEPPNTLEVRLDGTVDRVLKPGTVPCQFGRGESCQLRIGHRGPAGADRHISRLAGSIRWDSGGWEVHNESTSRPFDVVVRDVVIPLPPRLSDEPSIWRVSPPGLEIRLVTSTSAHVIRLALADPRDRDRPPAPNPDDTGLSTFSLDEPSEHERLLLTAKFLTRPRPGDAVGNAEAAELVNAVLAGDRTVTGKAVEDAARRWKDYLVSHGVRGIDGRENVHHLGRQLLAYGVIRQEDRRLLTRR